MTEGNTPSADLKKSYCSIYYPNMLKNYQSQTKLFEFSQDTNREELQIKKTIQL